MAGFNLKGCSIEGCARPLRARTWCSTHYARWQRTGDVNKVRKNVVPGDLRDRVEARIDRSGDCWLWTGALTAAGYAHVGDNYRLLYVHALMCEWHHGPKPEGHEVMHSCDTRACVNPDHLRWGTRLENVRDMIAKGRASWQVVC